MGGYDQAKLMEGVVMSIGRKARVIRPNTGEVLNVRHSFKRVYVYDDDKNEMVNHNGVVKQMEDRDSKDIDPMNCRTTVIEFRNACENVIKNKIKNDIKGKNGLQKDMLK